MKLSILPLLPLLLQFGNLSAQNYQQIDSMYREINEASLENTWELYNEIGWAYRLSYPDSTIYYSQQVLKSRAPSSLKATALNFQGIALVNKGNLAEAFNSYRLALDTALVINDSTQIAHSYNNLGRLLLSQGERLKAYSYINQALDIFVKLEDRAGIGYCYKSLVEVYTLQNDTAKMIGLLHKTLEIRQDLNDVRGQISIYQELANFYIQNNAITEAQNYLQLAMDLSKRLQDEMTIAEIELSLAELWYTQADYSRSMRFLRRALVVTDFFANVRFVSSVNLLLAKNYYALQQYGKARIYLQDIVKNSSENTLEQKKDALFYLAKISEGNGKYAQALSLYQQYVKSKDALHNIDKAITVERLENRLEIEEKDKEYELLKANEAKNQEVLKRASVKIIARNIILLLIFLLLLTLLAFYFRVKQKNNYLEKQQGQIEAQNQKIISQNIQIKQQNHELSDKNSRLQDIDQERETLLGMVSHDLKAPFQRISGLAEILSMNPKDILENKRYIDLIKNTSQNGSSLVNLLLNNSLIEKQNVLNLIEIDLPHLLNQLLEDFSSQAESKSVQLHLNVDSEIKIEADVLVISQIINNLVSNAIKYNPNDSNVYLSAWVDKDSKQKIKVAIKDEGPGFSEADKKKLYQKFTRLSAQPTNGETSHGLGLSIVKILTKRLNANIQLTSELGIGSEFILTFPKFQPETSSVSNKAPNLI